MGQGVAANGDKTVPVNDGSAPNEPGIKKNIAQGKQMEFPRYVFDSSLENKSSVPGKRGKVTVY